MLTVLAAGKLWGKQVENENPAAVQISHHSEDEIYFSVGADKVGKIADCICLAAGWSSPAQLGC